MAILPSLERPTLRNDQKRRGRHRERAWKFRSTNCLVLGLSFTPKFGMEVLAHVYGRLAFRRSIVLDGRCRGSVIDFDALSL